MRVLRSSDQLTSNWCVPGLTKRRESFTRSAETIFSSIATLYSADDEICTSYTCGLCLGDDVGRDLAGRRVAGEPSLSDRGERGRARELSRVAPGPDRAPELRGVRRGEEGVLEVARGLVVLLLEVRPVAEVVLARGELDLIRPGGAARGRSRAGRRCGRRTRRRLDARGRGGRPGRVGAGGSGPRRDANAEHRGVATHGKSVPGPACHVNLLVGRGLQGATLGHASSRSNISGLSRYAMTSRAKAAPT